VLLVRVMIPAMYEFTPADPTLKRPGHNSSSTEKRQILFVYIPVLAFVSLLVDMMLGTNQIVGIFDLAAGIALNVLGLMWARIDAGERRYELSQYFTVAVILLGVFAIAYYLFRSRGFEKGLAATGLMILYFIGVVFVIGILAGLIAAILVSAGLLPDTILNK
jgi:hypothetical protein